MITAYQSNGTGLSPGLASDPAIEAALWIDLSHPDADDAARLAPFGIEIPTLADMEEIEISNRLYQDAGADYLTVVLPGQTASGEQSMGPVTFILSEQRLVTVRHHGPRPFETYPQRASKSGHGCDTPAKVFLGLTQEIVGRLADHLEGIGKALDEVARLIYQPQPRGHRPDALQAALARIGTEGERLGRVRLALLTLGRALNFVEASLARLPHGKTLTHLIKGELRDIDALEVHAEFLGSRLALASDATLGTIDLSQNTTVRIVSVVAVLFLPPTLIASIYGMNFIHMPELTQIWGYPMALGLMLCSAVLTWAVFRWKGWL